MTIYVGGIEESEFQIRKKDVLTFNSNGKLLAAQNVDSGRTISKDAVIEKVTLYRRKAGTADSTIIDVNKNGVTMYTTQANRPTIPYTAGDNKTIEATLPDVLEVSPEDYITVDVDAIEVKPEDLTIRIFLK